MSTFFRITRTFEEINNEFNKCEIKNNFIVQLLEYIKYNISHNYNCDEYYPYLKLCDKYIIKNEDFILNYSTYYYLFLQLLVRVKVGNKILKKHIKYINEITPFIQICKLFNYTKYTNFLIIFNILNDDIQKQYFKEIIEYAFCNYDDRIFKFIINHPNFNENILINSNWCSSIFTRPTKYILKRLKYISTKIDITKYTNILFENLYNKQLIKPFFKYYYHKSDYIFNYKNLEDLIFFDSDDSQVDINEYINFIINELKTDNECKLFYWCIFNKYSINDFNNLDYNIIDNKILDNILTYRVKLLCNMITINHKKESNKSIIINSSLFLLNSYNYCKNKIISKLQSYINNDHFIIKKSLFLSLPVIYKYKINTDYKINRCILLLKKFIKCKKKI